jgi:hypothetical protein
MKRREIARLPPPDFDAMRAKLKHSHARKVADLENELNGQLWLLDRREPIDNVIYYAHENVFCFGWRAPLADTDVSRVLDFISEFPYPYRIKCADKRTLEGK